MIFSYGRTLPEYNAPAAPTDGFVAMKNQITSVRVVEPASAAQATTGTGA